MAKKKVGIRLAMGGAGDRSAEQSAGEKRLFFAYSVAAPWPCDFPAGRILAEDDRHVTVAFLGDVDFFAFETAREGLPTPGFTVAPVAVFDEAFLWPVGRPNLVAWHVNWITKQEAVAEHVASTREYMLELGVMQPEKRPWLPHVTICRKPASTREWSDSFCPLPLVVTGYHLYESVGGLHYEKVWSEWFRIPFEASEDGITVQGETLADLYLHAQVALAFDFPDVALYFERNVSPKSLAEIEGLLNTLAATVNREQGCSIGMIRIEHADTSPQDEFFQCNMTIDTDG